MLGTAGTHFGLISNLSPLLVFLELLWDQLYVPALCTPEKSSGSTQVSISPGSVDATAQSLYVPQKVAVPLRIVTWPSGCSNNTCHICRHFNLSL